MKSLLACVALFAACSSASAQNLLPNDGGTAGVVTSPISRAQPFALMAKGGVQLYMLSITSNYPDGSPTYTDFATMYGILEDYQKWTKVGAHNSPALVANPTTCYIRFEIPSTHFVCMANGTMKETTLVAKGDVPKHLKTLHQLLADLGKTTGNGNLAKTIVPTW